MYHQDAGLTCSMVGGVVCLVCIRSPFISEGRHTVVRSLTVNIRSAQGLPNTRGRVVSVKDRCSVSHAVKDPWCSRQGEVRLPFLAVWPIYSSIRHIEISSPRYIKEYLPPRYEIGVTLISFVLITDFVV